MKRHTVPTAILTAFLVISAAIPASAQRLTDNANFYHSLRSPWGNAYNPALFPKSADWYVTLPKASIQLSLPLSYDELGITYDPVRNVSVLDANTVLDRLRHNGCNSSNQNDINLFGFGFKISDNLHLTASAGIKTLLSATVPLGIVDFISQGNLNDNNHIEFGDDDILNMSAYTYASAGAAYRLPDIPLTIGGRLNVLDGVVAASVDHISIDLHTSEAIDNMTLTADYLLHTAGCIRFEEAEGGTHTMTLDIPRNRLFPNVGFTIDLGAKYELGIFDFSLSVVDLGPGIKWRQNTTTVTPKEKDLTVNFSGINLNGLLSQGAVDTMFLIHFRDSLLSAIDYTTASGSFRHSIPTRLYAGVSADFGDLARVGYLFQGQWYNGWMNSRENGTNHFACNNTLSAHLNLFEWLELSVSNSFSYSNQQFHAFNPGCAITIAPGKVLQLFAALEYLSSLNPERLKAAQVVIGINVVGL